jgi:hypothetical protein
VSGTFVYAPSVGSVLNSGAQALTAAFFPADTASYNLPSQVAVAINVSVAGQAITFDAAPVLTYGGATASVSATGGASGQPVIFSSLTSGVCSISGATVTPVTAGTCTIAANQAGNGNYSAAPQVTQNITVTKATPVITWANPADIVYGTALSATQLNADSHGVSGTFVYTPPEGTVLNAGLLQQLTATFTPTDTANFNTPAPVTVEINVAVAAQTIGAISFSPESLAVNGTTEASAITTSGLEVIWTSSTPDICTVSGSTVTGVTAGDCTIAANQAGNGNYSAAPQATQDISVGKADQTITAISFSPAFMAVNGSTEASATTTSGLTVTWTTTTPSVCTVNGSTVTGLAAGTCTIVANQSGDATYNPALPVTQNITVSKAYGDIDDNGFTEPADALLALQMAIGKKPVNNDLIVVADVAPLVDGIPRPDGKVTSADAWLILRKAVGL